MADALPLVRRAALARLLLPERRRRRELDARRARARSRRGRRVGRAGRGHALRGPVARPAADDLRGRRGWQRDPPARRRGERRRWSQLGAARPAAAARARRRGRRLDRAGCGHAVRGRSAGRRAAPLLLRQAERRARRHVHRRARLAGGQARGGRVAARRQEGQRQRVLPEGDGRVAARVPLGRGARQPDAQPQAARRRGRGQRRARRGLPRGERRSVSFSFRLKEWHLVHLDHCRLLLIIFTWSRRAWTPWTMLHGRVGSAQAAPPPPPRRRPCMACAVWGAGAWAHIPLPSA
mmetsp:Transcript_37230/g.119401  ORF Transcript_37230/g.119401 Transcript_37230/m.119401 type:complete len:294 (-) Transcript_37230:20-901(-)